MEKRIKILDKRELFLWLIRMEDGFCWFQSHICIDLDRSNDYTYMLYDFNQIGIDLWMEGLRSLEGAISSQSIICGEKKHKFLERMLELQKLAYCYFGVVETLDGFIRYCSLQKKIIPVDDMRGIIMEWWTNGRVFNDYKSNTSPGVCLGNLEDLYQILMPKLHLFHDLLDAISRTFLKEDVSWLQSVSLCVDSVIAKCFTGIERGCSSSLKELLMHYHRLSTTSNDADRDLLFWIETLVECTLLGYDIYVFHQAIACLPCNVVIYDGELNKQFINPCLRWLTCICQHHCEQQRQTRLICITECITKFLSVDHALPSTDVSSTAMEVIHNYLQQLLRRKLPFARQNADEKFKI
jgi:hypothetical protein